MSKKYSEEITKAAIGQYAIRQTAARLSAEYGIPRSTTYSWIKMTSKTQIYNRHRYLISRLLQSEMTSGQDGRKAGSHQKISQRVCGVSIQGLRPVYIVYYSSTNVAKFIALYIIYLTEIFNRDRFLQNRTYLFFPGEK